MRLTPKADIGELVSRLTGDDVDRKERARLLLSLAGALRPRTRLVDLLTEQVAPRLPVRDLYTLRQHHGALSGEQLAESLISSASRTTAAVGAAAGGIVTAELAAPPLLLTSPVLLTAQTLVTVAVELKLVAELHVVYGRAPVGTRAELAVAYLTSWATRRAIGTHGQGPRSPAVAAALSSALKQQLRQRVVRRLGRNATSLMPFLAGAVAGAELNRRETRSLGESLLRDLRPPR